MASIVPKLGLKNTKDDELATFTEHILQWMGGNTNFPSPFPSLVQIREALDKYIALLPLAFQGKRHERMDKKRTRRRLEDLLTLLAYYCVAMSDGDGLKFLTSGFSVKGRNGKGGVLAPPKGLEAFEHIYEHCLLLKWKMELPCRSYVIHFTTEPENMNSWKLHGFSSHTSYEAKNLESGVRYWFRVSALNAAGQSNWSEPASRISQ